MCMGREDDTFDFVAGQLTISIYIYGYVFLSAVEVPQIFEMVSRNLS